MKSQQKISDELEITQLNQRYGKVLDEKRYSDLHTVFSSDAHLAYAIGEDRYFAFSMKEAMATFSGFLSKCYWTCHVISAPLIELDGDRAKSSARSIGTHIQVAEDGTRSSWIVYGAYDDELVRTASGWRIAKRTCIAPHEEGSFKEDGVRLFERPPSIQDFIS